MGGLPEGFLTADTLGMFVGAGVAVTAVTNSFCILCGSKSRRVVGFVVSLIVAGFGVYAAGVLTSVLGFLAVVVNGAILFAVAFGVGETLHAFAVGQARTIRPEPMGEAGDWLGSWGS
jgi:hypothetical protein